MRLVTYRPHEIDRIGIFRNGEIYDLNRGYEIVFGKRDVFPSDMVSLIEDGEVLMAKARELEAGLTHRDEELRAQGAIHDESQARLRAPIPRPRKNIVCLGVNYAEHAEETGHEPPKFPVFFTKPPTVVIGPYDPIFLPKSSTEIDYEVELAFVFGKRGKNIPEDECWDYVFGCMVMNDITARDLQSNHQQWFKGKGLDTFGPMGPYLVTKDQVPDPHRLRLKTTLNGKIMQDSNTQNLIFKIPQLVSSLSADMTVEPGDIVSTGTPSGVGHSRRPPVYLRAGDMLEAEVEGIGILRNRIVLGAKG